MRKTSKKIAAGHEFVIVNDCRHIAAAAFSTVLELCFSMLAGPYAGPDPT
jgi:hypothetical protein